MVRPTIPLHLEVPNGKILPTREGFAVLVSVNNAQNYPYRDSYRDAAEKYGKLT